MIRTCAVKMDLSSLEGPPLRDDRFSAPLHRTIDLPRVEVVSWAESPRDSSHHPIPTPNAIQSSLDTVHDRGKAAARSRHDPGIEERILRTARGGENNRGIEHPRSQSALSVIRSYEHPTLRPSRSHSSLLSPSGSPSGQNQDGRVLRILANDSLVWLEDQKVWLRMGLPTSPNNSHTQNGDAQNGHTQNDYTNPLDQPPLQNPLVLQYYDPYANEYEDPNELPPSYESHGFVQPAHQSQWIAVAQRVGRSWYS
ncbi:hypothetical protein VTN77DRAFT_131 [Rasamsonia byssochlamydoides]|uniref:uncharacterized protein n=1 Tax=Rasamsonia byssochlamydoides TaxID=89139 RepID=UPI0037434879